MITDTQRNALQRFLRALIDQQAARILVPPHEVGTGYWFGSGNAVTDDAGTIWLVGRYRNVGDSRTGLEQGARGLECALFCSEDGGDSFEHVCTWSKHDLSNDERNVLSIEGTALYRRPDGLWELFISYELDRGYPAALRDYQKPGTGVWQVDCVRAATPEAFDADRLDVVLRGDAHPEYLHVKDPVVFDTPGNGGTALAFCTHPYTWASGNTGLAVRKQLAANFEVKTWELLSRGPAWDVASTRVTDRFSIPKEGVFRNVPDASVYFYDGCECVRPHEQNCRAKQRPRGHSCEELSGAAIGIDRDFPSMQRLSILEPWFISPHGTVCSRYVKTLQLEDGILAMWQQAQTDGSQPWVGNKLSTTEIRELLRN